MKLLIATRNLDKLKEIQAVFQVEGLELVSASAFPDMPDVIEDGDTLEANAIKKAKEDLEQDHVCTRSVFVIELFPFDE